MIARSLATIALALASCTVYTGPPEYAPQCAEFEPVDEFRLSREFTASEVQDFERAAQQWRRFGFDVDVQARSTRPNVFVDRGESRRVCTPAGCQVAGQVQWIDGQPIITIYPVSLDIEATAAHEMGHALAGNGCHPNSGDAMAYPSRSDRITHDDAAFVHRSQLQERP